MSSSFRLDINAKEGLSHAIDRALDKEFGQNITLQNINQWQSIFDIITSEEQAEQTQENQTQFTSADNDIRNNKHYQVKEGIYNLTQNTWNKIVEYVKQELNLEIPAEAENEGKSDNVEDETETKQRQNVLGILSNAGINTDDVDIDSLIQKYNELTSQTPVLDEAIVAHRIKNFALLQRKESFDDAEKRFEDLYRSPSGAPIEQIQDVLENDRKQRNDESLTYVDAAQTEAINKSNEEKIEALLNFGKERIKKYDKDNNGKITFEEFYDIEAGNGDRRLSREAVKARFDYLNINNHDDVIDEKEMASFYYAMSRFTDNDDGINTSNDITYREWWASKIVMENLDNTNLTQTQKDIQDKYTNLMNSAYNNL